MRKFFVFDNVVASAIALLLSAVGFLAFASEFGVSLGTVTTLSIFSVIWVLGLALGVAGVLLLVENRMMSLFGFAGLSAFGYFGLRFGAVGIEAMTNSSPGEYQAFLQEHMVGMIGVACALIAAHVIMEKPLIRRKKQQPAKA